MGFLPDPLHPAIVHFPIALSLVALLFDLIARYPRARSWEGAAAALWVFAALSAVVAVITGNMAHDDAVVPAAARLIIDRHEDLALLAMGILLALATLRVVLAWRGWFRGVACGAFLFAAFCLAGLIGYVGHLGGELVFRYGVGTAPVQRGLVPKG